MRALLVLLALGGCVETKLVECDDGRLCPVGTVCTATSCADESAVVACNGIAEGAACTAPTLADGVCATGVCVVRGCGNGAVDDGSVETCDDGNTVSGDGCTSTCALEGCGNGQPDGTETCDDSNTIAHDGCSMTCQREVPQWTTLEPSTDDERAGMAMQFIPARNTIVRFGGFDVYRGVRSGTHELVDDRWVRVGTAHAPSARAYSANAYDSTRNRWVLYGGTLGPSDIGETWEFDGTDWNLIPVTGPPVGSNAMTYDSTGQRIVMYVDEPTAQTWTYDGTAWTQLGGTQPTSRRDTSIAYDPVDNRVVLFAGRSNANGIDVNDVWVLTGDTWAPLTTANTPSARKGHTLIFDPNRNGIVLQGGEVDTHLLQGSTWSPITGTQARPSEYLGLVYDPTRDTLVRYGGSSGFSVVFDDIYRLGATGWTRANPIGPIDRTAPSIATDTKRDRIVMYGGESWSEGQQDETWIYDANGWSQLVTPTIPPTASYQGMAYDTVRDRMVMTVGNQTWELDGTDWQLIASAVSTPTRMWHLAYDPDHTRVIGFDDDSAYVYEGVDWTPLAGPTGVSGLYDYTITYDPDRHRVLMLGPDALYELDGSTWTQLATGPLAEPRYRNSMAYDPIRHRVVVVGGNTSSTGKQNDTWEWDGAAWTQVVTNGTYTPRETVGFAWLPSAGSFVLFGGNDRDVTLHDTWFLHWDPLP